MSAPTGTVAEALAWSKTWHDARSFATGARETVQVLAPSSRRRRQAATFAASISRQPFGLATALYSKQDAVAAGPKL